MLSPVSRAPRELPKGDLCVRAVCPVVYSRGLFK